MVNCIELIINTNNNHNCIYNCYKDILYYIYNICIIIGITNRQNLPTFLMKDELKFILVLANLVVFLQNRQQQQQMQSNRG